MKARSLLASVLMSLLFISLSFAQQPTTPQSLIGEWMVSAKHTSGATITTSIRLTQDSKFTATTTVNEQPFMVASGTWSLSGSTLEWRYERSSQPGIQPGFVDIDEVLGANESELRLASKRSGKTHLYKRVH
jgi:hypothetical protein